jgi:hypothetical protein
LALTFVAKDPTRRHGQAGLNVRLGNEPVFRYEYRQRSLRLVLDERAQGQRCRRWAATGFLVVYFGCFVKMQTV